MPTQLMRENLMAINSSEADTLSTPADEAVRQVLLFLRQDASKLRLSHTVNNV
jgi:hypothetical protein